MSSYYASKLKNKRQHDGYSILKLSEIIDVPHYTLECIEKGIHPLENTAPEISRIVQLYMNDKLDTKLDVQFDWVGLTFQTLDYDRIIQEVLMMNIAMMELIESTLNNYSGHFRLGDIKVYFHISNESMGTHISFSGNGCREFESLLEEQGRTWYDFFKIAIAYKARATRIDLAINDYVRMLDIPELYQKYEDDELVTSFHKIKPRFDRDVRTKESDGMTLYFGSEKSDFFIRFYEKDLEQRNKKKIHKDSCMIKNRYESVTKSEKARNLISQYIRTGNIEEIAFGLIHHHIQFYDRENDLPKAEWKINRKWSEFIGDAKTMKFSVEPKESFYEKTKNWLENYCAKSIHVVREVDRLNQTNDFEEMIKSASTDLDRKHIHMIKVATADRKDLIV